MAAREGIAVSNAPFVSYVTPRVIPLRIHWPGAMVNTLVYAAALLVPFTIGPLVRNHYRRRVGRCTKCGYDLHGMAHDVCPECGVAVGE